MTISEISIAPDPILDEILSDLDRLLEETMSAEEKTMEAWRLYDECERAGKQPSFVRVLELREASISKRREYERAVARLREALEG
jgi:hypothetical protein